MSGLGWNTAGRVGSITAQWRALTMAQRWTTAAIGVAVVVLLLSLQQIRRAEQMAILREQFHVPGDIPIAEFRPGGGKTQWPEIQGVARLTETQYRAYERSLNDPDVWRPSPFRYGGSTIEGAYSTEALWWRERPPLPRYAGDPLSAWGNLSAERFYAIERGRHFCFAVLREPNQDRAPARNAPQRFRAMSCWDLNEDDRYFVRIMGAIDPDTRMLHMIVQ